MYYIIHRFYHCYYSKTCLIQHALEKKICVGIDKVLDYIVKTHGNGLHWCQITEVDRFYCIMNSAIGFLISIYSYTLKV